MFFFFIIKHSSKAFAQLRIVWYNCKRECVRCVFRQPRELRVNVVIVYSMEELETLGLLP